MQSIKNRSNMNSKLLLIELNEINFDFLEKYIRKYNLKYLKAICDLNRYKTESESQYNLLEPWIQWTSAHTGKKYNEHKIFRLGDIKKYSGNLIFETIEKMGYTVGAISPMNADMRMSKPDFFIPDPWTKTRASGNWILKALYNAIHQSVNDNAKEKLNFTSFASLALGFFLYVSVSRWHHYIKTILSFKKPGAKALILDSLLADIHFKLWQKNRPDFSNLFLNSGAHIQHHYLFNSKAYKGSLKNPEWYCSDDYDPLIEILSEYDNQIGRLLSLKNVKLLVVTGLHQQPHTDLTYYWRLKEHVKFAKLIGIKNFLEILPRMSRDFLVRFKDNADAKRAESLLNEIYSSKDDVKLFKTDNRGNSLFVELVYPKEISENDSIYSKKDNFKLDNFRSFVAFVAIKNGEHNGLGYLASNEKINCDNKIKLVELKKLITDLALSTN